MELNDRYIKAGYYLRKKLEDNGYEITNAIEIDSSKETTIFNNNDRKGIIISQSIKKYDVPENITLYEGGFGLTPKLDVFAMSVELEKTYIPTNEDNYFLIGNTRHINAYKELVNNKNVIFYYYEPKKKNKSKVDTIYIQDTFIIGDKEYQKESYDIPVYGKEEHQLIIYEPTGRILTNKSNRTK